MELNVYVTPRNLFPAHKRLLTLQADHRETIKVFKDRLAKQFNSPSLSKCHFIWAGSVLPDATRLFDTGLKCSYTICLVAPSELVHGASTGFLNLFQHLQYYFPSNSNQRSTQPLIECVATFIEDLSSPNVPWKPENREGQLLHWVIKVLRNIASPSIKVPAVKWFGEYGCALVSRQTPFEEVVLTLICLDNWSFHVHCAPSSREHNSIPGDHQAINLFVGSVSLDSYGSFLNAVEEKLKKVQERKNNERTSASGKQGHHKTPGMIYAIMLDFFNDSETSEIIPKGGFTDVGLHTGGKARNTSWHLVVGVILHLLDSEQANDLFWQVLLQLPLRMAEHSVRHLLTQISDP